MLECLFIQQEGFYNSALFSSDKKVIVGRVYRGKRGYEALIIDDEKAIAYMFGTEEDEGLYSVKRCKDSYLAVGHSGDNSLLVVYNREKGEIGYYVGPEGILWQTDCELAVGGKKGKRWHLMLLSPSKRKAEVYTHKEDIYAYSLARRENGYVVVGRIGKEGNYDGFLLWLNREQKPVKALRTNWKETDYLRYVSESIATGRLEMDSDSEGLLVYLDGLKAKIYRRQGFDYFRYADESKIFGEGDDYDGMRKALLVKGESYHLFGKGFSAVRFYDREDGVAYGYVYLGGFSYGLRFINASGDESQKYVVQDFKPSWTLFKLKPARINYGLKPRTFEVKQATYTWKNCHALP